MQATGAPFGRPLLLPSKAAPRARAAAAARGRRGRLQPPLLRQGPGAVQRSGAAPCTQSKRRWHLPWRP